MASRILAPVLVAALAAPQDGWAEDELLPFQSVAAEARQTSAPGGARVTASADAAAATSGEPTGPPAPVAAAQGREQGAERESPAGRSRLLRALADKREAEDVRTVDAAPVIAAGGCPRGLLRRLLAGAAGEADALSALGIEREILTLCRERQEILAGLFEAEAALGELRAPPSAPATAAEPAPATRTAAPVQSVAPSPLRAALVAAEDRAIEPEPQASARVPPRYAWFSIVGTAGALRAGITDGTQVWFVREGDPLPGDARIVAIAARPPGVRVTSGVGDGGAVLLPYFGTSIRVRMGGTP